MTKHRSASERRSEILHAARSCFIESGYDRSRMDDIAKTAGISKGGVYFHFKSKAEIFETLVSDEFERSMGVIKSVLENTDSNTMDRLSALAVHYFQAFLEDTDMARFVVVMGEMTIRDDAVRLKLLSMHERYLDAIEQLIRLGIEDGELRAVDPRSTAVLLKAMIDGIENAHALGWQPDDVLRLVTSSMDFILGGIGLPKEANDEHGEGQGPEDAT